MELVRRPGYMKISLHDDFESLDPQISGRRQRMGWRSRNASPLDTWPNDRGSSANLRRTLPTTSGMSEQLSHRDDFYHSDLWVSPAATNQTRGRGTPNQRGAYANQRGTNTNQRWTYPNQRERGTYANQRGTNADQRGTNVNQRGTNTNQRGTNVNQRGTNTNHRGTNTNQRGTNANQRGMNANQRATNTNQGRTFPYLLGHQRGTSISQRSIPNNQRATQTSPRQGNQSGLPTARGSMWLGRLPATRGGLLLNRRAEPARGRTSSSQRGTDVDRGRSWLERISPGRQRETSPQSPNLLRERHRPFKPRQPNVQEERSRSWWLPRRASVSDSALGLRAQRRSLVNQRGSTVRQRGSPVGQRESPVGRRGSPVDQRGPLADRRRSSADQRGATVDRRGSPVGQRGSLADRRRSSADQRGATVDRRGSPVGQRGSLADRRRSSADQRGATADQRGATVDRRGSPVGQRGSLADRRRSSADQRGTTVDQRGTTVGRRGSPVGQRGSPASQHRTPVDRRGSPVKKRGSTGDQHEMSQQARLSGARSLSWRRGDSTPPKAKFKDPTLTSWLKKLFARLREKFSAAKNKPKIKAGKDESTSKSEEDSDKDGFDNLTPGMLGYEELHKAETDAKGLDPESLMFRDGHRHIDMVITYKQDATWDGEITEAETRHRKYRSTYQANLIKEGLELELEHESLSFSGKIWFLKVHIPWETQLRIAGVIGLKLPTKRLISVSVKTLPDKRIAQYERRWYVRLLRWFYKIFDLTLIQPEPNFYLTNRNYRREEQFLVKERHTHFAPAQRSHLVMQILIRAKYDDGNNKFGISRLLAAETYNACFPLHEGPYYKSKPDGTYTDRQLLYLEWARASKWYKRQPLWLVQRYFGDQIGLYYAWLGFYTKMLISPAIVGSLCFLYGILSEKSMDNIPSKEICDTNGTGNITLCPLCDKACSYHKMYEACIFAQLTYYIDNPATVFFAIFMSFWATTFLVLWKREEAVFRWQWDLTGTDPDENPRPEYEASVKTTRINPVTGNKEPYRSPWHNFIRRVTVSTVVFMMMAISISTVLGVITYRISMVTVIHRGSRGIFRKYARIFTIITGAVINLFVSEILIKIFTEVALVITNLESPRTQTDYDDSVTFKLFIFEFINFYATIVYIAFFKGSFYFHPGDKEARQSPFLKIKGDICFQAGCLSELSIMLGISMIGKQTCHNIKEMGLPVIKNWWRILSHRSQTVDLSKPNMAWEQDYHLQDPGHLALYEEYLEMIMQYGFVTLFVAAFPLGPLCALINNICEIRMDAYKMVTQARRPLPERVEDIGAWYGLLRFLTYLAVVSNAFVIAYTSDFIPRMVYKYGHSPTGTLEGYVNHSLSWFNTSEFQSDWGSDDNEWDPPMCAYRGYRNPPDHPEPYGLSPYYWHVFAARLAFVVVFEHLVFTLTEIIHVIIPKVPTELLRQIKREQILEKELKYERNKDSTDVEFFKSMAEGKGEG